MRRLLALLLIVAVLPVAADEATDYQVIRGMVRDGAFGIAVSRMDAFLETYPEGAHAKQVAAMRVAAALSARYYTRVHETAAWYIAQYCDTPAGCADIFLHDATAYYLENRYREAAETLAMIAPHLNEQSEDTLKGYHQLAGDVAFARNQYDEAVDRFNSFLKIGFDNETRLKQGMAYYHLKKYARAERVLGRLAEEGYEDPRLHRYRGLIAFGKEKFEEASGHFARADEPQDRIFRVHTLLQLQQDEAAYSLFRETVPLQEVSADEVTLRRVETSLQEGALLDALADMERGPLPVTVQAGEVRFSMYDRLRRYDLAAEELHRIALVSEDPGRDFYRLGEYVLTRLNDMERAHRYYGAVLEKDPDGSYASLALMNQIKCSLYRGDRATALKETTDFLNQYGVTSPITDQAYMILGKLMLERGVYEEAIKSFENIVANYPDSNLKAEAGRFLVDSYFRQGMYEDALKASALEVGDNLKPDMLLLGGTAAYLAGEPVVAAELYGQLAALAPEKLPRDLFVFSLVLSEDLEGALAAAGDDALLVFAAQRRGQDVDGAVQTATSMDPMLADVLLRAADMVDQDIELRVRLLTQAVELAEPGSVTGRLAMLALEPLLVEANQYRAILELEPQFIQQDPAGFHGAQGILKKARAYREKGKLAKAVSMYQMAVNSFPDAVGNDEAYFFLHEYARPRKESHLEKIVTDYPDGEYAALAAYKLGLIRFNQKAFGAAVPLFRTALDSDDPAVVELRFALEYYLGVSLERTGDVDGALAAYRRYLELIPGDVGQVQERIRIGLLFQKNEDYAAARAEFERLLALEASKDHEAELTYYIAECMEGQGELETALQQFLQVTYLHASELMWSTTARFRAARICEQLEYYDDAVKLYQKIADAHKGQIQGEFARKKLEELSGLETP